MIGFLTLLSFHFVSKKTLRKDEGLSRLVMESRMVIYSLNYGRERCYCDWRWEVARLGKIKDVWIPRKCEGCFWVLGDDRSMVKI